MITHEIFNVNILMAIIRYQSQHTPKMNGAIQTFFRATVSGICRQCWQISLRTRFYWDLILKIKAKILVNTLCSTQGTSYKHCEFMAFQTMISYDEFPHIHRALETRTFKCNKQQDMILTLLFCQSSDFKFSNICYLL